MVSVLSKFKSSPKSENEKQERETEDKAVQESVEEEHTSADTQVESPSIEDVLKQDRGEIDRNLQRAGNDPSKTTTNTATNTSTPNGSGNEARGEKEHRNVNPFTKLIKNSVSQLNLSSKNDSTSRGVGKLDTTHNNNINNNTGDTTTHTVLSSRTNSRSGTRSTSASPSTPSLSSLSRNLFFKSRPRGSTVSVAQNHEYNERHDAHGHPIPYDNDTTTTNHNNDNNNNNNNNNNNSHSGSANINRSESLKKSSTAPFKSSASSPNVKSLKSMKSISIHNTNPFMHATTTAHHNMKKTSTNSSLSKAEGSPAMVYNPYGSINKTSTMLPNATNSSLSTAVNGSGNGNGNGVNHSISNSSSNGNNNHNNQSGTPSLLGFYLTDGTGEANLLPLPIENPNDHIPEKFKQTSVVFSDDFALVKDATSSIGKGASSDVRTVYNKHLSQSTRKKIYCLKKLCMFNKENPNHFYERCAKEFIIAKSLNGNKHVISTYLLLKIPTTSYMSRGWGFIMEYCDSGDLFNLIVSSKWKKIPTNEKLCIFKQVALGLNYIHSKGIAHKDIKPENILITHEGVAKITDFGVSDFAWNDPEDKNSGIKLSNAFVGSPPYTSPEVMVFQGLSLKEREKLTDKYYDPFKMDLWSLGILFFTMVYQNIPFHSADRSDPQYRDFQMSYSTFQSMNPKFKKEIHPAENPKTCTSGPGSEYKLGKDFPDSNASRVAWKLSDPDPETRYTFDDLVHDPWFVDVKTCTLENPEEDTDAALQHEWTIMNEPLLIPQEEYYKRSTTATTTTSKTDAPNESAHSFTGSSDPPATPTNASSVAPSEETKHESAETPKEASKVVSSSHSEPEHKRNPIVSRNSTSQLTQLLKSNPMPSPFASTTSASTAVSASDYASSVGSPNGGLLARSTTSVSKGSSLYASPAVNPVVQKYITKYKEEKRNIKIEYMNKKVSHNHS